MTTHGLSKSIFALLALAALLATGCGITTGRDPAEAPVIGVVLPLSGQYGTYGKEILAGIRCGENAIKREYISSPPPELVVIDDKGDPARADAAVRKLHRKGASIVLVGYTSAEALAVKSAAAELKLPVLTPAGSNNEITERNPYMFRANFSDAQQAKALAYYAFYERGCRQMATMLNLDENAVYSRDLGRQTAQSFVNIGGGLRGTVGFREDTEDFRPVLRELMEMAPDVIFIPAYARCAGRIVRQARELGFRGMLLGGDGWQGDDFLKECGDNVGDAAFAVGYTEVTGLPEQQDFVRRFRAEHQYVPGVNEALGYDAVRLAYIAVRAAANAEETIRNLGEIRSYTGACGAIQFLPGGGCARAIYIKKVKPDHSGKMSFVQEKTIPAYRTMPEKESAKEENIWTL